MPKKPADTSSSTRVSMPVLAAGVIAMLVAAVASVMLVYAHFKGASLPGCGEGSGCASLTSGPWGKIPGLNLPISFVGAAYFSAVAVGWIAARGVVTPAFRWIVRLGAAASIFFFVLMLVKSELCVYCMTAHIGNFAFWLILEAAGRGGVAATMVQPTLVGGVFVAATAGLYVVDLAWGAKIRDREAEQLENSQRRMVDGAGNETPGEPFTGRYLDGPEEAAIRIVILSDYQCPDCRMIEQQVRQVLSQRDDVSFSAKHFPMSNQCNPFVKTNPHPNACWAARAAETAGILRGNAGFWEMHHLLFDRKGSFTDAELGQILTDLGYDVRAFLRVMQSQETLAIIEADIEEGKALGLHFTPMIFVNGVELKGFRSRNALLNTVAKVAATNPEPRTAAYDQPPMARQKYVDDWIEQPVRREPPPTDRPFRGAADAKVNVVVWGDLSSSFMATLDDAVQRRMADRDDVSYRYMNYPVSTDCNPEMNRGREQINAAACLTAKAVLAAEIVGGADAFWSMYDWLIANRQGANEAAIVGAAANLGLNTAAFRAALASNDVARMIASDAEHGDEWGVGRFVPAVYVNQKWVPRWRLEGEDLLGDIFEQAAVLSAP